MAEGRSGGVRWEETGSVVIYSIGFVKSQRKKSNTRESFLSHSFRFGSLSDRSLSRERCSKTQEDVKRSRKMENRLVDDVSSLSRIPCHRCLAA